MSETRAFSVSGTRLFRVIDTLLVTKLPREVEFGREPRQAHEGWSREATASIVVVRKLHRVRNTDVSCQQHVCCFETVAGSSIGMQVNPKTCSSFVRRGHDDCLQFRRPV